MTATTRVDFWFDPTCPWAWMTSRWVDEVAKQRDLDVTWHIMSLAVLNENADLTEERRIGLNRSARYTRLVASLTHEVGPHITKPLYDALGTRIHLEENKDVDAVIAAALAELELDAELARFADDEQYEAQLRASHADGIGRVGQDVGTPIIAVEGVAFFGPVISPAPKGEQAVALWDGVVAAAAYDGFFELKRSRTRGPSFD